MFETQAAQAPQPYSPATDLSEYEIRMQLANIDRHYRSSGGTDVNLLALSNEAPPNVFRRYIDLCRALRAKTPRPAASRAAAAK